MVSTAHLRTVAWRLRGCQSLGSELLSGNFRSSRWEISAAQSLQLSETAESRHGKRRLSGEERKRRSERAEECDQVRHLLLGEADAEALVVEGDDGVEVSRRTVVEVQGAGGEVAQHG